MPGTNAGTGDKIAAAVDKWGGLVILVVAVFGSATLGLMVRDFRDQHERQTRAVESLVVEMRKLNVNHYMLATEITNVCFEVDTPRKKNIK